jgi:hypothetical protein
VTRRRVCGTVSPLCRRTNSVAARWQGRGVEPSGMEPLEIVYRCPLQRCAGRPGSQVTEAQPLCSVSPDRRELLRERLS